MDRRRVKKLDHVRDQVLKAYENYLGITAIAELFTVSPVTVRSFLISEGVQLRKKGRYRDHFKKNWRDNDNNK